MRSDRLLLLDIQDAIEVIREYLPADRAAFDSDPPLQSHIYRQITIIGEAAGRLSRPLKAQHPEIPWREIEGMRHVLVHDYFKIDRQQVYDTAANDAPRLKPAIQAILESLPETELG